MCCDNKNKCKEERLLLKNEIKKEIFELLDHVKSLIDEYCNIYNKGGLN